MQHSPGSGNGILRYCGTRAAHPQLRCQRRQGVEGGDCDGVVVGRHEAVARKVAVHQCQSSTQCGPAGHHRRGQRTQRGSRVPAGVVRGAGVVRVVGNLQEEVHRFRRGCPVCAPRQGQALQAAPRHSRLAQVGKRVGCRPA